MFQIMGFNYAYCGCPDVEAFVALQHAGADQQLECFARFIARPPYLAALRAKHWVEVRRGVQRPGAREEPLRADKMAAAYATFAAAPAAPRASAGKRRTAKPKASSLPPGRATFVPVAAMRRKRTVRKRNVRPDSVDLRDWEYRPSDRVRAARQLWPNDPRQDQAARRDERVHGLLAGDGARVSARAAPQTKQAEDISAFMLYSMARRYDEWAEEDENEDSGSSLRGALKGWAKHGASRRAACGTTLPHAARASNVPRRRLVARRRQAAARRVLPHRARERARHARRAEGSRRRLRERADASKAGTRAARAGSARRRRTIPNHCPSSMRRAAPPIKATRSRSSATRATGSSSRTRGARQWGAGGFAVLPYEDWLRNAMDCWVVQLGVVTVEHEVVAQGAVAARRAAAAATSPSSRATRRWPITRSRRSSSTWRTRGG